ncbi:MAG: HEAT repeat domain-containing protein [Myxococcales bacterium]|nr:HEAT repeat domain-containing protein [Myxococcales bacterium]
MSNPSNSLAAGFIAAALVLLQPQPAAAQRLSDAEFSQAMTDLGAPDAEVRVAAVDLLGRGGRRRRAELVPHLRRLLRTDPDWRVRASAGRAVGRLSLRQAVPELVTALGDAQLDVRVVAAAALWRLPDESAVVPLIALLSDADPRARQWAALALGVARDVRAVTPLARLLADSDASVRMDAIRSLGRMPDIGALEPLRAFAADSDKAEDERLEAINSIALLAGPAKVNALVTLLSDSDSDIRERVVRSLGQVGDALVIPALRRARGAERVRSVRAAIDAALREINQRTRERAQRGGAVAP